MRLNKFVIFAIIAIPAIAVSFLMSDPFAVAKPQSKVHFTKTFSSTTDPGTGSGQLALVLSPNKDSIYTGSLTFTANQPVEIIVLHQIPSQDSKGQPTWSVDNNSIYGITEIEAKKAGTFDFTGSAVAFRAKTPFVVTASVDGWIRGQPIELISQTYEIKERSITLADEHVPVTIPMRDGFFAKAPLSYIITDASNSTLSNKITEQQKWSVKFAPKLRWAPSSAQDTVYVFANGIKGDGIYGFQGEVFGVSPAQKDYTPLASIVTVSWKAGQKPQVLQSADEVLKAQKDSRIKLVKTNVTINAPQIVWPGGQIQSTNNTESLEKTQVIEINKDSKKVTFVAHRSWGPDGRATYYIIPSATPKGPADIMQIPVSPRLAKMASSDVISDMYQFKNGIKGSGPLGFQPSIISATLDNYVPVCRISIVEWKDEKSAIPLETLSDLESKKADGSVFVSLARPLSEDHIISCPIIESPKSNKG